MTDLVNQLSNRGDLLGLINFELKVPIYPSLPVKLQSTDNKREIESERERERERVRERERDNENQLNITTKTLKSKYMVVIR